MLNKTDKIKEIINEALEELYGWRLFQFLEFGSTQAQTIIEWALE